MENNTGSGNTASVIRPTCGSELSLAMARFPIQQWTGEVYDGDTALSRGTLFPALDLPFIGKEVR